MSDMQSKPMEIRNDEGRAGQGSLIIRSGYQNVTIKQVENGFIVEVGCKTFVANTWIKVSEGLELYFKDPDAAWKKYITEKK